MRAADLAVRNSNIVHMIDQQDGSGMDEVLRPLGLITPQYSVQCAIDAEPGGIERGTRPGGVRHRADMQEVLANVLR